VEAFLFKAILDILNSSNHDDAVNTTKSK